MPQQISFQDMDFLRMSQDYSQVISERTSGSSLKKQPKSSKKMPLFLDLRRGGGHTQEASSWMVGVLPGRSTMLSGGVFLNEENESVYSLTSTDTQQPTYYLLLNTGEKPRETNQTLLSDILEKDAEYLPKYALSAKACQGILNRANRRGKKLPEILQKALENQCHEED